MNKVLVEVYVPVANIRYDVYIPLESKIGEIAKLLANAMSDLSNHKYMPDQIITMSNYVTGKEYDKDLRCFETDIENGSQILIL